MQKITSQENVIFLNINNPFCKQDYGEIGKKILTKALDKEELYASYAKEKKLYGDFLPGGDKVIKELVPVCPYMSYKSNISDVKYGKMLSNAKGNIVLSYLYVNGNNEVIAQAGFAIYNLELRNFLSTSGSLNIAQIITKANEKSELSGYEFRYLYLDDIAPVFHMIWFHGATPQFAPVYNFLNLKQGEFYTEQDVIDAIKSQIADDFLDTKSSFCNQDYSKISKQVLELAGDLSGNFGNAEPVCPHFEYIVNIQNITSNISSSTTKNHLYYLYINTENEMVGKAAFEANEDRARLIFSNSSGPGTHSIARIITDAATKPELKGYEMRILEIHSQCMEIYGMRALWFHNEDGKDDMISPLFSHSSLAEGYFYTEKEVIDALINDTCFKSHGDL